MRTFSVLSVSKDIKLPVAPLLASTSAPIMIALLADILLAVPEPLEL